MNLSKDSKRYLDPEKRKPIEEYLNAQKRFKGISEETIREYKDYIKAMWKEIEIRLKIQEQE
jgi:pyruvate ferredoxin oxidoreductase beta subunit